MVEYDTKFWGKLFYIFTELDLLKSSLKNNFVFVFSYHCNKCK